MTAEDLYALPDDDRKHELAAGMLVAEPLAGGRHGFVCARLSLRLGAHVAAHRAGAVFGNDTGFVLARSPDTVRGPDVAFVRRERLSDVDHLAGFVQGAPDLAVEVLSPSHRTGDVSAKIADYLAAGTRLVWVIDPASRTAVVHRPLAPPRAVDSHDVLDGEDVLPGLRIPLAELFEL